jgi:hypothetical protein
VGTSCVMDTLDLRRRSRSPCHFGAMWIWCRHHRECVWMGLVDHRGRRAILGDVKRSHRKKVDPFHMREAREERRPAGPNITPALPLQRPTVWMCWASEGATE